jgi:hypothetical protein
MINARMKASIVLRVEISDCNKDKQSDFKRDTNCRQRHDPFTEVLIGSIVLDRLAAVSDLTRRRIDLTRCIDESYVGGAESSLRLGGAEDRRNRVAEDHKQCHGPAVGRIGEIETEVDHLKLRSENSAECPSEDVHERANTLSLVEELAVKSLIKLAKIRQNPLRGG